MDAFYAVVESLAAARISLPFADRHVVMDTSPDHSTGADHSDRHLLRPTQLEIDDWDPASTIVVLQLLACAWAILVIPEIMSGILTSFCGTCKSPTVFAIAVRNPALAVLSCAATAYLRYRKMPAQSVSRLLTMLLIAIAASPYIASIVADLLYFNRW